MNYCSKPLKNYREMSKEDQLLPRLFTPSKVPLVQHWVSSGPQQEAEKLTFLRNVLRRHEEREATRKVLKMSFHPEVVPQVEQWLCQAPEEEKRAITRMFRTIASDPNVERAAPTAWDEDERKTAVSKDTGGKATNSDEQVTNTTWLTSRVTLNEPFVYGKSPPPKTSNITMNDHFVDDKTLPKTSTRKMNSNLLHSGTFPECSQTGVPDHVLQHGTLPRLERPASTQYHSKKVHWRQEVPRPATAGGPYVAGMRNEFDIFPDWRAPHRAVVPMTQVPYRVRALRQTPRTTKHACGTYGGRDFVIHPEWITH